VKVEKGGHGEALNWSADGVVTLVAPIIPGDLFQALFTWDDRSRRLTVDFTVDSVEPDMAFSKAGDGAPAAELSTDDQKVCACKSKLEPGASCGAVVGTSSADCVRTYADDCERLLSCIQGYAVARPTCVDGSINAGAALHCYPLCTDEKSCDGGTCIKTSGIGVCVRPESPGARVGKASSATVFMADGSPDAAKVAAFDDRALAAINAAQKALEACDLRVDEPGEWFDFMIYDWCEWKEGTIPAFSKAVALVEGLVKDAPALNQGPRGTVIEQLKAYRDWLELADRAKQSRGSCSLFQQLAVAWNTYQPDKKVDTDPKQIVEQYHVRMKGAHPHYISKSFGLYAARKRLGIPLPWRRGVHGPRLPN